MGKKVGASNRLPKGKTQEGINYCININQEETLKVFLNDGEVPLDNNATAGVLRSLCLHKHAWKQHQWCKIQRDHLQHNGNSKGE